MLSAHPILHLCIYTTLQCDFAAPPIRRWNIFLYSMNRGCFCNLLWPIYAAWVTLSDFYYKYFVLKSPILYLSSFSWELGSNHVKKPKLVCWRKRDGVERPVNSQPLDMWVRPSLFSPNHIARWLTSWGTLGRTSRRTTQLILAQIADAENYEQIKWLLF